MKKLQTTLDKITTLISAILCAAMMVILFANVVLRLIPGIGGFKWYMESSQYLNVWSMLIVCIGINAMGTNLRVEVVDSILGKTPLGKKIVVIIRDVFIILFYVMVTYGGYQLCTRAKQAVSTMPQFTMGQVYTIFPIAGVLCILSAVLNLVVELTTKPEGLAGRKPDQDCPRDRRMVGFCDQRNPDQRKILRRRAAAKDLLYRCHQQEGRQECRSDDPILYARPP